MLFNKSGLVFLKQNYTIFKRSCSNFNKTFLIQCLKKRALLQLKGNDASIFLQGLITNDMKHLQEGNMSMFAMFLNSKGRILYESIIYNTKNDNSYLIECDSSALASLKEHILSYKVRRKIGVESLENEWNVWSVIDKSQLQNLNKVIDYKANLNLIKQKMSNCLVTIDPRLACLGLRILVPQSLNLIEEIKNLVNLNVEEDDFYDSLRYKLGIGEGLQELHPEKSFPMEMNGDYLHGISFQKGCYIGQELTARTYHTGVIRKRLMPLVFKQDLHVTEIGIPIFPVPETAKSIGKLLGVRKNIGLGLLRIEEALKADELIVSDNKCSTNRPFWWPVEAPKKN